jgi:hypothetical protein
VLDDRGQQAAQAQRTPRGYMGGVEGGSAHTIVLAPGQAASALLEGLPFPATGQSCKSSSGLLVTPPDNTSSVMVPVANSPADSQGPGSQLLCQVPQVHPVVAGTDGIQGTT